MIALLIGVAALLLFVLQRKLYEKKWDHDLEVELDFDRDTVFAGDQVIIEETVSNAKKLPLPTLTVKFETSKYFLPLDAKNAAISDHYYRNDIFTLPPMQRMIRKIPLLCTHRGYFSIHDISYISTDLFYSSILMREKKIFAKLYVYPAKITDEAGRHFVSQMTGEVLSKRHQWEDPFEFRGIRDYTISDEMRTINWKATAKTGDLKVNMKNYTSLREVRIFVNLDDTGILKHEGASEYAISMAAALAEQLLQTGMQVSLYSNGIDSISKGVTIVAPSGGNSQHMHILQSLARIDIDEKEPEFAKAFANTFLNNSKSTHTILLCSECRKEFIDLVEEGMRKGLQCSVIWIAEKGVDGKEGERIAQIFRRIDHESH